MSTSGKQNNVGFDAAIRRQEDDHLNRWPFAREIYEIAVTGPEEWSIRIGIYGEWGTGKTSVLQFITLMAQEDGHILIQFNPWEHSSKQALWNSFADAVYDQLGARFGNLEKAGLKRRKAWLVKAKELTKEAAALYSEHLGNLVGSGLDLLKENFGYNEKEQNALKRLLKGKRIIVLVDDLDRTAPELVPEILFALKQLMDIPGFCFICAFDPLVVGEVLGRYHPGFGDGLKFLEKIIDCPRWLPTPTPPGLVNLAFKDAKVYCPYVPEAALRTIVPLLPLNPRVIRQFIRLLTMLGPQVARHYEHELRWPVIVAATALRVRYPQLGPSLLADNDVLGAVQSESLGAEFGEEPKPDKKAIFLEHSNRVAAHFGQELSPSEQKEIVGLLGVIFSPANVLFWSDAEKITSQLNIGEAPRAVTEKEYDQFLALWTPTPVRKSAEKWIGNHARAFNRLLSEVYRDLFKGSVRRYALALQEAETALTESDKNAAIKKAEKLFGLVECLTLHLAGLDQPEKWLEIEDLELLFAKFVSFANSLGPIHLKFEARNEALLLRLINDWKPNITPLVAVLKPYGYYAGHTFDQQRAQELFDRLRKALLPNLARQVQSQLREPGFAAEIFSQDGEGYATRSIMLDLLGPMWGELRAITLALLNEAAGNRTVQENAYELVHFFDFQLHETRNQQAADQIKVLLDDHQIRDSIWAAATATRLSPAATARLSRFVKKLSAWGFTLHLPVWWNENIKAAAVTATAPPPAPELRPDGVFEES